MVEQPKAPGRLPSRPTETTPAAEAPGEMPLATIYDQEVLRQVTAEIEAEESGQPKPAETARIELPELPPPPEYHPYIWLLRQLKRALVLAAFAYIVFHGYSALKTRRLPDIAVDESPQSVPLPKADPQEAHRERERADALKKGQTHLAAADLKTGLVELTQLAKEHPDTRHGQKAMLTLASTYRFQMNDPEAAVRWYRTYLRSAGEAREVPATMIRLASYLDELGRPSEAKDLYQEVVVRFPLADPYTATAKRALERPPRKP